MLLFRSLALGLLGTCVLLLAARPPYEIRVTQAPVLFARAAPPTSASIVDVASSVAPTQLPGLLHLSPGERVVSVDDVFVRDDLEAGVRMTTIAMGANRYIDLTVEGATGSRRVLVLFH